MTDSTVEIFYKQNRVASHKRLHGRKGQYSTAQDHMPEKHKQYQEWNGDRFRQWARKIGANTYKVTESILASKAIEEQSYLTCRSLLKPADTYSPQKLEEACRKACQFSQKPSYKSVKNMLRTSLRQWPQWIQKPLAILLMTMGMDHTTGLGLPAERNTMEVEAMLNNATIDKLITMRLKVMADAYILQEQDPAYRDLPFSDRFAMLVDAQYNQRRDNRMKRLVKEAQLDQPDASVMNIDYHSGRNLNRRRIQQLATCEYIVDSLNIFITSATGSGKTYLACALAMEALKQYITVKYVRMADFLLECTVAWDEKRYDKVLQAYARPKLLIIDEWLDIELTKNDLHAIKELVHRRRRKSSTIFCSQILKEGWYQALGGENTESEAIIDRITYDGYDINIEYTDPANAVSMRKIYSNLKPID